MKLSNCNAKYSSIVEIGELVQKIESETDRKFLKLHRGVMDITTIEMNWIKENLDLNKKSFQQYSPNDGVKNLVDTIKNTFGLNNHHLLMTPGGMAGLDLILQGLSNEQTFWLPNYHWGSWNKIITLQDKKIDSFDDFNLYNFNPNEGVVLLCYPSNPTGYQPSTKEIRDFIIKCENNNVTVLLDLPYFYLFNDFTTDISELLEDNVIVCSSFSKSIGLSGYRIGYVATKNKDLYNNLKIRSLYKYNSISTAAQEIILELLTNGMNHITNYKNKTLEHIQKNIKFLVDNNLLFDNYTSDPVGPFAIVNMDYNILFDNNISSVPLNKFTLNPTENDFKMCRISVAVDSVQFEEYMTKILEKVFI